MTREIPTPLDNRQGVPKDPSNSWMAEPHLSLGMACSQPTFVDFTKPRVGRVIVKDADIFALYPADPANRYCPPYPGVLPRGMDDPHDPITCFSDGSLGKFDPRFYPQVFDEKRPWLPFHKGPHSLVEPDLWQWFGGLPHYLPANCFFHWYCRGDPTKGGRWNYCLLGHLFRARRLSEGAVDIQLQVWERHHGIPIDMTSYTLPAHDTLTYEQTEKWSTYQEGRDAIGRTCRYTAELQAMSMWLHHFRAFVRDDPKPLNSTPLYYQGTWTSSQFSKQDWKILNRAQVAVYILAMVPYVYSISPGTFDGGEHLRVNALEGQHGVKNIVQTPPAYKFPPSSRPLKTIHQFPESLSTPLPPRNSSVPPPDPTDWVQPWTSRPNIAPKSMPQHSGTPFIPVGLTMWFQARCRGLFSFFGPGHTALTKIRDWHPFFHVATETEGNSSGFFEEVFDSGRSKWYFKRVSKKRQSTLAESSLYCFFYPQENITIYSQYPFPGRPVHLCRNSAIRDAEVTPVSLDQERNYYRHLKDRDGWNWSPADEEEDTRSESSSAITPSGNMIPVEDTAFESEGGGQYEMQDMDADVPGSPVPSETSPSGEREHLMAQRAHLDQQTGRRLFLPFYGLDLESSTLVPFHTSESPERIVWCMRISGLHGDASLATVEQMLKVHCAVLHDDIVVANMYHELTMTSTVDLGLRYPEDALWIWCILHGVCIDDGQVQVHPLCALKEDRLQTIGNPTSERSLDERLRRLHSIAGSQETWPQNGLFKESLDLSIKQIALIQSADVYKHSDVTAEGAYTNQLISWSLIFHIVPIILKLPSLIDSNKQVDSDKQVKSALPRRRRSRSRSPERSSSKRPSRDRHDRADSHPPAPQQIKKGYCRKKHGEMTSRMRRSLIRGLCYQATRIRDLCRLPLDEFTPPPKSQQPKAAPSTATPSVSAPLTGLDMCMFFKSYWDWLDHCWSQLEAKELMGDNYDFSVVPIIFGSQKSLRGLRGEEYHLCSQALRGRAPRIPQDHVLIGENRDQEG